MITARVTYTIDGCDHYMYEEELKKLLNADKVTVLIESTSAKRITLREYASEYKARYFNMRNRVALNE